VYGESAKTDNAFSILPAEDEKIKLIGTLLGNDSSRAILRMLLQGDMTANNISQKTGMLVSLVIHHLQNMQHAGLVKVSKIVKDSSGHDMKYYSPTRLAAIIFSSNASNKAKSSKSFIRSLNRIYRFTSIGLAGVASFLITQNTSMNQTHGDALGNAEPVSSLLMLIPVSVVIAGLIIEHVSGIDQFHKQSH
jgi:predicted ArsR family transcriptional regulator